MTNLFNIEDYKNFVRSQVLAKAIYLKIDITEQLLAALFQFEVAPSVYLKNTIPYASLSYKYKKMFNLSDKTNLLKMNTWFLHKFGYRCCFSCKQIKSLSNYGQDTWTLFKITTYCRSCTNLKSKIWKKDNLEYTKEYRQEYQQRSSDIIAAISAKRRAVKLYATPKWLTKEQHKEILNFYIEAKKLEKETGNKYHVDHIVPLQGEMVSGLHVPWNLQVITAKDNIIKSNKYIQE